MNKIYCLLILFFLCSCATTIQYVGSSNPQTKKVDVYVTEGSIKKPYSIIGRGYINPGYGSAINWNQVQRNSVRVGIMHGADAVLILQRNAVSAAPAFSTRVSTDTTLGILQSSASTEAYYPVTSFHEILYLKYD